MWRGEAAGLGSLGDRDNGEYTVCTTHLPLCHSDLVTCHSANSLASFQVQTTQTLSLKYEEAHVISLVDNATNIIVSFLLQVREAPFCNMCLAFDPSIWDGLSRALFWAFYYHFYAENNFYELFPYRQYFSTSPLGRSNLSGLLSFLSL